MSRHNDPFHLIQIANPVPDPDRMPDGPETASTQALIEEIIGMTRTETTTTETSLRPTRRRRTVALAFAGLAAVSVAAVWAITRPEATTNIQCPGNSIIAAVSGDPVEDCANEMRRQGNEPRALAAYVNENGGVVVVEVGTDIPSDWQPLPGDFRQDTAIIELEAALADASTGLRSQCYSSDDAVPLIQQELARFELDWTVDIRDNADGIETCAFSSLEPENARVTVVSIEGLVGTGDEPWVLLGNRLDTALADECLALDAAATTAADLATQVGLDLEEQVRISTTVDQEAACTRASVTVGGLIFVDLRGPASR